MDTHTEIKKTEVKKPKEVQPKYRVTPEQAKDITLKEDKPVAYSPKVI